MTAEQKALIQSSFAQVLPIADRAAELFYAHLFALDPTLRPLFRGDLFAQGRALMGMLKAVVAGLDRLDQLLPAAEGLGKSHAGYGVQDAHYDTVAAALLWTLQQGLGASFTAEVEQAWIAAYSLLADVMKGAAKTTDYKLSRSYALCPPAS